LAHSDELLYQNDNELLFPNLRDILFKFELHI
jgi:hypothetical protein